MSHDLCKKYSSPVMIIAFPVIPVAAILDMISRNRIYHLDVSYILIR